MPLLFIGGAALAGLYGGFKAAGGTNDLVKLAVIGGVGYLAYQQLKKS